ncbi:MAG: hypothetical protein ACOC83_08600 [Gemmatimonadota bacterium]
MQSQGLTPFALVFMLVSMGSVTALMVYCFYRVLRNPAAGSFDADAEARDE